MIIIIQLLVEQSVMLIQNYTSVLELSALCRLNELQIVCCALPTLFVFLMLGSSDCRRLMRNVFHEFKSHLLKI